MRVFQKSAFWVFAIVACITGSVRAEEQATAMPRRLTRASIPKQIRELRAFQTQSIRLPVTSGDDASLSLEVDGESLTLDLQPFGLRAAGFRVLVQGEDGVLREVDAPLAPTFRGQVRGRAASRVTASMDGERLTARIEMQGDNVWHVEPLAAFGATADASVHVSYRSDDLVPVPHGCGTVSEPAALRNFQDFGNATSGGAAAVATWKICDIAFDADFEFFQANGASVINTVHDIENVLNRVALMYEDQLGITFELTTILVRTAESDPYSATNHETLLNQFRSEWNSNRTGIHRDVAHLMTGKEIDGLVIGSTFTGTVCESCGQARGYGFSQSRFSPSMAMRTCLTAHEIGHSFGAVHCDGDDDCDVMCSMLGGCGGNCTMFGDRALAAIADELDSVNCLTTLAPAMDLPFCDSFDHAIDGNKWPFNAAGSVALTASSPPSEPGALFLDTCCTGCASAPDEIRSNFIRLGASEVATLSYQTQHTGGAGTAGSRLFVDYFNRDGDWAEINALTANGANQPIFTAWQHPLPADALHDEFRIRFRLEKTTGQAHWYIDDVSVVDMVLQDPVLYVRSGAPAGGDGRSWATAFRDLQDALNTGACARGVVREIWVARGTYRPDRGTGDRRASFNLLGGVSLLGGFAGFESHSEQRDPDANATVLSGDIGVSGNAGDNSFHVVTAGAVDRSAVLDGVIVMGGTATGTAPDDGGGGLFNVGGSPTIQRCTFRSNVARNGGAAHNSVGAGPAFVDCLFQDNQASSAGGALYNSTNSSVFLTRCRFLRNQAVAAGGAAFTSAGDLTATDCLFSGNHAASGGAMQNFGSAATLTNCTLSRNSATGSGGGIVNISSSNSLRNCILWGNSDLGGMDESAQIDGQEPSLQYSCLQGLTGGFGGVGNSGADPRFVDADGPDNVAGSLDDNLRLQASSPAIDTGEPEFFPEDGAKDLDGHARILCGGIDRGAYEFGIGDDNCDRDVDLADFAEWAACFTGPQGPPIPSACRVFDFNADGDVDLRDYAGFQKSRTPSN